MAVTPAASSRCLMSLMACLFLLQQTVSGKDTCTSPFQATDNDPNACFLHPPEGTKEKELYCEAFEANEDITRKTHIFYQEDIDVCFYHLVPRQHSESLEDGCCSGGLPPGR